MKSTITREELYEAVWSKSLQTLAKEWNTTYVRLVQACQELDVPRPGPGHWQLIARGRVIEKEPLPERKQARPNEFVLMPPKHSKRQKAASSTPAITSGENIQANQPSQPTEPDPKEIKKSNAEDLLIVAERAVLDMLRQAPKIDFWKDSISEVANLYGLSRWIGQKKEAQFTEGQILRAIKHVPKDFQSFRVHVKETPDKYRPSVTNISIEIILRDGCEWKDAWEEAWSFHEMPNPHCLTDNALRLLKWAQGPKNTGTLIDWKKVGAQAGLRKNYYHINDHLTEIRLKADPNIQWENGPNGGWHGQLRIWFEPSGSQFYHYGPLNPPLGFKVFEPEHAELERFKNWLYEEILKPGFPSAKQSVGIFDICDRKTLSKSFGKRPPHYERHWSPSEFFELLRLVDGIEIRYNFADGFGPWLVVCQLEEGITWGDVKARLIARAQEIPLEKRYNLSADARALLQWILELRKDEFLLQMTPAVEEHLDTEIGIQAQRDEENTKAYLELLVEEINQRTEFRLRTIAWHKYGGSATRILFQTKETDLDSVVRAVQILGLKHNKLLDVSRVKTAIDGLLN